jgi:heat-inducible transcriptional repressor
MSEDSHNLPELSRRQEEILSAIIRAYSEKAEAVSSKYIVEAYGLDVSSATVRNEMARLEEMGYISAPHTSAGRIPTTKGYRYFVRDLLNNKSALSASEQSYLARRFQELPAVLELALHQAATLLARSAATASLITAPSAEKSRFKHIELIAIEGRLALMVLVLQGGIVHQRMLTLASTVPQAQLSEAADRINAVCADLGAAPMRVKARAMNELEREVVEIAADLLERSGSQATRALYQDGLSEIIHTFPDGEGAQQAVRVYEERALLDMLLNDILADFDDVRVIIAGDDKWSEISRLGIIISRYGVPGRMSGALGVLGPTHLDYGRAIRSVRQVSSLMTDRLYELYGDETDERGGG